MNIEQTISLYLDGELTSEQEAEFHHLLSVSPEARTLFRQHMSLQTIARQEETLLTPEDGLRNSLFARLQSEGLSSDGVPSGVAPSFLTSIDRSAETAASPSTEQVRRRPDGGAPLQAAAMRPPVANEREEKGKKRRLLPFLIPMLLVAVAGSVIWLDRGNYLSGSDEETIASAVETEESRRPEAAAQPLTDADVPPTVPVDPQNAIGESARSQPERRVNASAPFSRDERDGRADLRHSIPPSGYLSEVTEQDLDLADASVTTSIDDANASALSADLTNSMILGEGSSSAPAMRMSSSVSEDGIVSAEDRDVTSTNLPEPQFARADRSRSWNNEDRSVAVHLLNEQGDTVTPLYENRDEILATLRSQGIFIGHDGTFSFGPVRILDSADADAMAMRVLADNGSSLRFQTSADSDPIVYVDRYQENVIDPPLEVAMSNETDSESREATLAKSAENLIASDPLDRGPERFPFISIEGGLSSGITASERMIWWVQDDPVRQTSQVRGEFVLKVGLQEGSFRLFTIGGIAPYDERRVTFNSASAAIVPPVTENVVTTRAEIWGGLGSRYVIRLTDQIATGVEGVVGAGTKRFHAGISVPVSVTMREGLIVEILPNLRYRNAHVPIRPTTGTSPFEETISGPAYSDELEFGTSIGLILLLR